MSRDAKRFIIKLIALAAPLAIIASLVIGVDPFGRFRAIDASEDGARYRLARLLNEQLWKELRFREKPQASIILGDSRANHIPGDAIERLTGHRHFNFSYGGGSLAEAIATFWYADSLTALERVVIVVGLENYNASKNINRVEEGLRMVESAPRYLVSLDVLRATWRVLLDRVIPQEHTAGRPTMSREEFWRYQLEYTAPFWYRSYIYPTEFVGELEAIAAHCKERGIELMFVIPPMHRDMLDKLEEFGREPDLDAMRRDFARLGELRDLLTVPSLTEDRALYGDPVHLRSDNQYLVAEAIWSR